MKRLIASLLVGVVMACVPPFACAQGEASAGASGVARSSDPREQARAMAVKAAAWLRTQQDASGGWSVPS
ncbi:MAG: hypothetical protein HUU19_12395, partial [Phycisphaerales bacterium]|nr:hypothetical protein [Phycisphaerales bacterium]